MELISKKYRDAYEENIELCANRCEELIGSALLFEEFLRVIFPNIGIEINYSSERLQDAIVSYFYDIYRYKDFHGMLDKPEEKSRINFQKIYSFTAKWVIKEKPFYTSLSEDKECSEQSYLEYASTVNECIVLTWIKMSYFAHFQTEVKFTDTEWHKLVYTMKFRDIQTSNLELFFQQKGIVSNIQSIA